MTSLDIQRILAALFLGLGGWALLFPSFVERLWLASDHYIGTPASAVLIGCFGAQACLCAVVIALSLFRNWVSGYAPRCDQLSIFSALMKAS